MGTLARAPDGGWDLGSDTELNCDKKLKCVVKLFSSLVRSGSVVNETVQRRQRCVRKDAEG